MVNVKRLFAGDLTSYISLLLVTIIMISGCTSLGNYLSGTPVEKYIPQPNVHVDLTDSDSSWSLSKGVYYKVTCQVYNTGDATAKNVYLNVQLKRSNSGTVDDSKRIYVGTLSPGESRSMYAELDGTCDKEYRIYADTTYE